MGKGSGKRVYSGVGRNLQAAVEAVFTGKQKRTRAARAAVGSVEMVQPLENRVMMSVGTAVGTDVDITWKGATVEVSSGEYIVQTQYLTRFQSLASKEGFTNVASLGHTGEYSFDSTLPVATLEKLAVNAPLALGVLQPNMIGHIDSTSTNDPLLDNQWGLSNSGQIEPYDYEGNGVVTPYNEVANPTPPSVISYPSPPYPNDNHVGTVGDDINATKAWDLTTGSKNVVVAVLDSGIDLTNPDLIPNIWTNPLDTAANGDNGDGYPDDVNGWNFVADNNDVSDDNGHGTNVAGIIGAAGNNGLGVTGVDWNVSLLPVKVAAADGSVTDADEIAGINYCITLKAQGINIVAMNESLGGAVFPIDVLESDAVASAGKAGILDVVAAGNDSENLDSTQFLPAKLSLSSSNVITVGAVDNQFNLAYFSNYGASSVDLAAPGVDIYSTSPTYPVTLNTEVAQEPDIPQFTEDYGYLSGTSQATPFVTGIIALEAAANPEASPQELKTALLEGVTYDPALAASNGKPALVATSGVANAYKAVQNILEDSVSTNTTHGGAWQSFYGSDGAYVVGESTSFPSFVDATLSGGTPVLVNNSTKDLAGLQRVSDPTERLEAYEASATNESINLDFTDGNVHQTTLYLADLDHKKRVETIGVYDGTTGALLSAQTISNFTKGEYLTYDLRGNVTLTVINDSGPSAVYSGIFFDTPPTTPTTYVGTDTATTGQNWRNQYGSQGAFVVGNAANLPSYVSTFSFTGETGTILSANTHAASALQLITNPNTGIESYFSSATSMDLNVGISDSMAHLVTLYFADYGNKQRQERINVINSVTGAVLATQDISNFAKGEYVTFSISASATFQIVSTGGPNAVISGVFFDAPFGEKLSYVGTDTVNGGNWLESEYGLTTSYIVGDNFPGVDVPTNPDIEVTGGTETVLNFGKPVSNSAAVVLASTPTPYQQNIEAYLYTDSSMVLAYNPTDAVSHTLALYFADYQKDHRIETVTIYNPATLQVLSSQVVSNFSKGKYLVFNETGQLLITITNGGYPNAVISGVFST
jgi:subtilisin family serine protease